MIELDPNIEEVQSLNQPTGSMTVKLHHEQPFRVLFPSRGEWTKLAKQNSSINIQHMPGRKQQFWNSLKLDNRRLN